MNRWFWCLEMVGLFGRSSCKHVFEEEDIRESAYNEGMCED